MQKMRRTPVLVMALVAVALVSIFFVGGCSNEQASNPVESTSPAFDVPAISTDTVSDRRGGAQPTATAYPAMSIYLRVPWIAQVPPGDWNNTKNCGQAIGVMLGGYFNAGRVSSDVITWENSWLAKRVGDNRYLNANGWYTNFTGANALGKLLREFHAVQYGVMCGNRADAIVNELAKGRPVIAGVMISGGNLVASGGEYHWVLVIGWDGTNLILNDPGTDRGYRRGAGIRYSVAAFEASWRTSGNTFVPVWK